MPNFGDRIQGSVRGICRMASPNVDLDLEDEFFADQAK